MTIGQALEMNTLLEQASAELAKLPVAQQASMAQWILVELKDEARWDRAFAGSLPQLERLAQKALEDYKAGRTQDRDPDTPYSLSRCLTLRRRTIG